MSAIEHGDATMSNVDLEDIYELSPLQQGMLFQQLLAPATDAYINQIGIDVDGSLDPEAVRQALRCVTGRHAMLRTSFVWEGVEQPYQVVHRSVAPSFARLDLGSVEEPERAARFEAWRQADRRAGFDLREAPLLRLTMIAIGPQRHRLVWTCHHIVLEGLSFSIVLGEFWRVLAGILHGAIPDLPQPTPYSRYIEWLRTRDRWQAERYWRKALKGIRTPTRPLPERDPDAPRAAAAEVQDSRKVLLSRQCLAGLRSLGRTHRLTLNTLIQGAVAIVASCRSGEREVVFGEVVSGRPADLPDAHAIVGMFVNALPARIEVQGKASLAAWLEAMQQQRVEMREYSWCAQADVQAWSEVPRGQPLFELLYVFENVYYDPTAADVGAVGGMSLDKFSVWKSSDQPLTIDVFSGHDPLELVAFFDPRRYAAADVERLLDQLNVLLERFVATPDCRVEELFALCGERHAALPLAEREQVLVQWNATAADFPRETLHALFEAQAKRTPHAPAVADGAASLSYAELNAAANRLAHHLLALGVGRGSVVALCVERSVQTAVAMLGVLKAGGAYVALEPGDPAERLLYMLQDARVEVLVTQARMIESRLPAYRGRVVDLDAQAEAIARGCGENPQLASSADDVAYVIYTSGSTGRPKGVLGLHRGMVNRLSWMWRAYPYGADERCCQKTTLSFVDAVAELFSPLLAGVCVVIVDETTARDPRALAERLARERVTRLVVVPSLLRALLGLDEKSLRGLACVRHWVTSGERLEPELEKAFHTRFPGAVLLNLYGSSEVSADVTCFDTAERGARGGSLIGRPIFNTRAYVLDEGMNPVAVGVPGELYIGGAGLARGYLGQAGLSAERFVADPFAEEPGSRLYRTGDMVRYQADGVLEYLGRADQQLKVRGHRIEPAEVEAALASCPGVREAAVAAEGGERLVAYYVSEAQASVEVAELRAHVRGMLPAYMVPSLYVKLEALPLTASGKVNRRALPAPERAAEALYVAPRTPTEEILAGIWAQVLGVDRVGIESSFFDLGGHSLLAMQVISRANAQLQVELSLESILSARTVRELAAQVDAARMSGAQAADKLTALRERLMRLSPDERQALLAEARSSGKGSSR
jgi:amino acid adenylation domain-containing protein